MNRAPDFLDPGSPHLTHLVSTESDTTYPPRQVSISPDYFTVRFLSCLLLSVFPLLNPSPARAQTGTPGKTTVTLLGGIMQYGYIGNAYGEERSPLCLGLRVSRHLFLDQSVFGEVVIVRNSFAYGYRTFASNPVTMIDLGFASNLISRYYTGKRGLYLLFGGGLITGDFRRVRGLASASTVLEIVLVPSLFLRLNGSAFLSVGDGAMDFPGLSLMAGLAADL